MVNDNNSGILILLAGIGTAAFGALGAALFMNTETGRKTDAHLSNAYKTVKECLPRTKSCKNEISTK